MDDTFWMGTTSSITMQSSGKVAQRAPAVGAKMWCLFLTGRLPWHDDNLPVLNLLSASVANNSIFAPAGKLRVGSKND